jgi:hypothetical protein
MSKNSQRIEMKLTFTTKNLPIHRFQQVEMRKIREKAPVKKKTLMSSKKKMVSRTNLTNNLMKIKMRTSTVVNNYPNSLNSIGIDQKGFFISFINIIYSLNIKPCKDKEF